MKLWSEEVAEARALIESVVKELDPGLECDADGHRGFYNDTVDVVLSKGERKAFVVVSAESWINAKTNPQVMKQAFNRVIGELKLEPDKVFLITTAGLKEVALGTEWEALKEPGGWTKFEDEAAFVEGDREAERMINQLKGKLES
ncbi:MAG: hypothetical protein HY672_03605 [Chloroflexi bacterium]|nr:hypothetical protein [Chloroflexota bacterium]